MTDLILTAFGLGNAAILTNACMLPLYPGLIAFLAGNASKDAQRGRGAMALLGVLVLAGILTTMLILGLILASVSAALDVVLPVVYAVVIGLGVLLIAGRNPFGKLTMIESPRLRNRYLTAYAYGLLFGPMTLPCTGPVVATAFLYSVGTTSSALDGLVYFLAFGLGFGYPLVLLPLIALPIQRRLVGWLARMHPILNRASGVLLIAVGVFGILTELLPRYLVGASAFEDVITHPTAWGVYWLLVSLIVAAVIGVGVRTLSPARVIPTAHAPDQEIASPGADAPPSPSLR